MASAFTHALVGAAIGLCFVSCLPSVSAKSTEDSPGDAEDELQQALDVSRRNRLVRRLPWICALLAVSPDLDVLMHALVRYSDPFGHRGAFHSLAWYAAVAISMAALSRHQPKWWYGICLFCALASHSLLDMLTSGGLGIGLFWPITTERYFFPWRPIPVSPLSIGRFFSAWGVRVLRVELLFAAPLFVSAVILHRWRRRRRGPS